MNRRIKILIFAVCIVLALGITLYPLISNVVGEKYRSIVESRYDKAVEKLNTMELIAEKEEAVLYNRTLQGGTENAFSREALAEAEESYGRLLNVRGDGIMGYIQIPKIGVELPIYHGTAEETLEKGVGHLLGTSLPVGGIGTHCVLTGHSGLAGTRMFSDLDQLNKGDVFYVRVLDETHAYMIMDINGDKAYVAHVLRYYPIGRVFMGDGNTAIVAVAQTQLGNEGGLKYCEWYGYPYRVEWCVIFVGWCAEQCGYLDEGVLPKMEGVLPLVDWFRECDQWQYRDYEPNPGDLIFYDWENDGIADHVGIVERVENGLIYSVEGNVDDRCIENSHYIGTVSIYGFGLPQY